MCIRDSAVDVNSPARNCYLYHLDDVDNPALSPGREPEGRKDRKAALRRYLHPEKAVQPREPEAQRPGREWTGHHIDDAGTHGPAAVGHDDPCRRVRDRRTEPPNDAI